MQSEESYDVDRYGNKTDTGELTLLTATVFLIRHLQDFFLSLLVPSSSLNGVDNLILLNSPNAPLALIICTTMSVESGRSFVRKRR